MLYICTNSRIQDYTICRGQDIVKVSKLRKQENRYDSIQTPEIFLMWALDLSYVSFLHNYVVKEYNWQYFSRNAKKDSN